MVLVDVDVAVEEDDVFMSHSSAGACQAFATGTVSPNGLAFSRFSTGNDLYYSATRIFYIFRGITIPQFATILDATLTGRNVRNVPATIPATLTIRGVVGNQPNLLSSTANTSNAFGNQILWDGGVDTATQVVGNAVKTTTIPTTLTVPTDIGFDVKDIVQEMVNTFSYVNDDMLFRFGGKIITPAQYPGISQRGVADIGIIDSGAGNEASLIINYSGGQVCIPTSDISNSGSWSDAQFGNNDTELWDELDEGTLNSDDDSSAVKSPEDPQPADTFEVKLDPCIDPLVSTDHIIRIRVRGATDVKIQLYQGAGLIAESGVFSPTLAYQTFEYTLSGGEADSITDYDDLRIRVVPQ